MIRRYTIYKSQHNMIMTEVHELTPHLMGYRWDVVTVTNDNWPSVPKCDHDKLYKRGISVIGGCHLRIDRKYTYTLCHIRPDRHSQPRGD